MLAGLPQAELIFDVVFFITLTSVLIQGTSIPYIARRLRVTAPAPAEPARAEAEGLRGKGGLMGRAERILVFCWGVGLAGVGLPTLVPAVWILAVLTWLTVVQRFYNTWMQLKA